MANEIQELITDFQDFFQMIAPHIVGHKTATEKFFNTVEKLRSLPSTESRESDAVEFSNEEILKLITEELEREYSENEAGEMLSTARIEISSKYAKVTYSNGKQDLWKITKRPCLVLQPKKANKN